MSSSCTPTILLPQLSRPCKGPLFRSSIPLPDPHLLPDPIKGSLLFLASSLKVLPSTATWKGGQHSGCRPSVQEGCTHLWAFGVTHPKESTPPHRTQKGQTSFHFRDSAPNLKQRDHLPLQPAGLSWAPSCRPTVATSLSCLESTMTLCVDFFPMETSSPGDLLIIPPYNFLPTTYGPPSIWAYLSQNTSS